MTIYKIIITWANGEKSESELTETPADFRETLGELSDVIDDVEIVEAAN